jgi:hypothetical protein
VSFAAVTPCAASQLVFIVVSVYFVSIQSGNFWIHPRMFHPIQLVDFLCIREDLSVILL